MSNRVIIGIGSNIDPCHYVAAAVEILASRTTLLAQSPTVRTKPIGRPEQDDYLNTCVLLATDMDQPALQRWLHEVEQTLGRHRTADRYAPRTIDLDVLVWNGEIVSPDVAEREFLQDALCDLGFSWEE
ncbi:MAG: 2-amino-4-hydroxy-6-hydroxymethyldihydropteridine diphosphokinase [Phycisphaerae bacterium]|nr:2-amino-4-hydroxy-6-hydroxymethyldihydropteridine diphosphokinase [Phycisphaerae bacterium]